MAGPGPSARGMTFSRQDGASSGRFATVAGSEALLVIAISIWSPVPAWVRILSPDVAISTSARNFGVP